MASIYNSAKEVSNERCSYCPYCHSNTPCFSASPTRRLPRLENLSKFVKNHHLGESLRTFSIPVIFWKIHQLPRSFPNDLLINWIQKTSHPVRILSTRSKFVYKKPLGELLVDRCAEIGGSNYIIFDWLSVFAILWRLERLLNPITTEITQPYADWGSKWPAGRIRHCCGS